MLARGVVQDQIDEHANVVLMGRGGESLEVFVRPVVPLDSIVVGDVVAVIARRLGHRHEPHAIGTEPCDVVELLREAAQVADPIAVAVVKRTDENFVADVRSLWALNQETQHEQHVHGITSKLASRPSAELAPT